MGITDILMPLIALITGMISLHVDPKDKTKRWLLITGLIVTAIVTISINQIESTARSSELQWTRRRLSDLTDGLKQLSHHSDEQLSNITNLLHQFGFSRSNVTPRDIERSIKANEARNDLLVQKLIAEATAPTTRKVTVEYFPKNVDPIIVRQALEQGGFIVIAGSPRNDLSTNSIWAGDEVTVNEAKLVALTLVRAGVALKAVRRFHKGDGTKSLLIQVGADPALIRSPVLSVDEIAAIKTLVP